MFPSDIVVIVGGAIIASVASVVRVARVVRVVRVVMIGSFMFVVLGFDFLRDILVFSFFKLFW